MATQLIPARIEVVISERQNEFTNMVNALFEQGFELQGNPSFRPLHERVPPSDRSRPMGQRPALIWGWSVALVCPAHEVEYDESDVPE